MPPRAFTNPTPKTNSAREAVKAFYCELCSKGYARMNEFEAHESSYDHQHKKRLKEMKQMQRDPQASAKARKAERKADEKSGLITIKPMKLGGGNSNTKPQPTSSTSDKSTAGGASGFKRGGFKSAFGGGEVQVASSNEVGTVSAASQPTAAAIVEVESASDDDYEHYDPLRPTGCPPGCPGLAMVT